MPGLPWQCAATTRSASGDLHDRAQLGHGELLVHGMVDLGEHPARGADLDHARVPAQLLPDRAHALVDPVGQAQLPGVAGQQGKLIHPGQREGMQVAVTAGGAEDRAGRVDRRPVEQPLGHRPGQVDAQPADLANRGNAGVQRRAQIADGPGGPQRNRLERQLPEVERSRAHEVSVAVPQPGHDRHGPAGRRPRGVGRPGCRARVADLLAVQHDDAVPHGLPAAGNEQVGSDPFHVPSAHGNNGQSCAMVPRPGRGAGPRRAGAGRARRLAGLARAPVRWSFGANFLCGIPIARLRMRTVMRYTGVKREGV